jgi:predicted amidohydrolase YtcJ
MVTGPVDLVITGVRIYTVDTAHPWAEAVAVHGGRIASVGSRDDMAGLIGRRTRFLELPGRMVLPGFQDAHVHPGWGGLMRMRCDLLDLFGQEAYLGAIASYASGHPNATWITGGGWSMDAFPGGIPRRESLDAIIPDRPVFLESRDAHGAWVNSRALELAGVTRQTPDPPHGRIERDADGTPSGCLQEEAVSLVERLAPAPTAAEWEHGLRQAQKYLHSLGITAWQDAWVHPDLLAAYRALAGSDELTARVVASLRWDPDRGEEQVWELAEQRADGAIGRLRAPAVKIFADGVIENRTGALLEPYLDEEGAATENWGIAMLEPEAMERAVVRLDAEGFQVHVHGIGDRAIRMSLDAFEAARRTNGARDARHHIAHIQLIHPSDIPRFAELEVVANGQPFWASTDGYMRKLTLPVLGPERASLLYPFRSLLDSGAVLAFGSDWTVSTPNPLQEMEVAVTRVSVEARGDAPFLPEQRITLEEAIAAFTQGSAFVNRLDVATGSIEVGKLADLVVLDRDILAPGAGPVGDARVLLTMVEGEVVFSDDATLEEAG